MPFINGRYHINPAMGDALEAAREAESALLAAQQAARDSHDNSDSDAEQGTAAPVHRVEIDAAELVPHATGRAVRGFSVRVHRGGLEPATPPPPPETHVFADHRDLLDFLRDALAHK